MEQSKRGPLRASVFSYLKNLGVVGVGAVTGAATSIALLALDSAGKGISDIPNCVLWSVAGVGAIVAPFWAYHKQRLKLDAIQAKLDALSSDSERDAALAILEGISFVVGNHESDGSSWCQSVDGRPLLLALGHEMISGVSAFDVGRAADVSGPAMMAWVDEGERVLCEIALAGILVRTGSISWSSWENLDEEGEEISMLIGKFVATPLGIRVLNKLRSEESS